MASSRFGRWISYSPARRMVLLLPLVFAVVAIVVLSIGLLPVKSIAGLECDAVLKGGEPKEDPAVMAPIRVRAEKLCGDATSGRKLAMFGVGIAVLIVGVGAVLAPADRLERYITNAGEAEARYEEEARQAAFARENEARQARDREARAVAEARREAQEQAAAPGPLAIGESREARVARARAARLRARAEAGSGPAKKVATRKAATKKVAGKKVAGKKVAGKKVTAKKVTAKTGAAKPKKLVTKPAKAAPTKATKATKAVKAAKTVKAAKAVKAVKVASGSTGSNAGTRKAPATKVGTARAKVGTRTRKAPLPVQPVEEPTQAAQAPGLPVTEEVPVVDQAADEAPVTVDLPGAAEDPEASPAPAAPTAGVNKAVVKGAEVRKVGTSRRASKRAGPARPAERDVDGAPLL